MSAIDKILDMWEKDAEITGKLDECSRETPILHAKYLRLLSQAKLKHKDAELKQLLLLKKKYCYFDNRMTRSEIESSGWEPDPFDGHKKPLKGEMEHYYNSDPQIQESVRLVEYYKTMIDTLKEIVDNIKWRHQTIKNIIEWKKFEDGQ